jgi:excisionase family DNA binding protein
MQQIYTTETAADLLSVNEDTIRRWARTGRLRGSRIGGRGSAQWRFTEQDIADFLEAHRPQPRRPSHG